MLAFDSALYLGMRHPAAAGEWEVLTTGQPAAYAEDARVAPLCRELAVLAGSEDCAVAPSTLHLFWDLFGVLAGDGPAAVLVDAAAYPIARWCAARIGAPCRPFAHGDVSALAALCAQVRAAGQAPLVLADGYSPGAAGPSPLPDYAACAARYGGWLVVDDTQAFGLLGRCGGGSMRLHRLERLEHVVSGASLAKALGAPMAALFGSGRLLRRFRAGALTRVHCSPPCAAVLSAAQRALALNAMIGDQLRARLRAAIEAMRAAASGCDLALHGGSFPVQLLAPPPDVPPLWLHSALAAHGIRCLAQPCAGRTVLGFLLTAGHSSVQAATAMRLAAFLIERFRRQHEQAMRMRKLRRF